MGVIGKARESIPAQGDYLDKEELVRAGTPFGITNVAWDETGGYEGASRWLVSVAPWYDGDDVTGLISFGATPIRQAVMQSLQDQLDESGEPLGPVVLIRAVSKGKNRYYDLADYDESTGEADRSGHASDEAQPAPAATNGRTRPRPGAPAPAPAKRGRPAGTAKASTGQRERAAAKAELEQQELLQADRPSAIPQAKTDIPEGGGEKAQEVRAGEGPRQGVALCPDCGQEVRGRIFPDTEGNPVLIHQFCPELKKGVSLPASEA